MKVLKNKGWVRKMRKVRGIIWGLIAVAIGVILLLNAFGVTEIDLFFDGWWTLLIIVPCTISFFTSKNKVGDGIGIAIGVILLLNCRDILDFEIVWKILLPVLVIAIGLKMIFRNVFSDKMSSKKKEIGKHSTAIFSGEEINYKNEFFNGASYTAVFGGIDCDLREAIIKNDATIYVTSVFGGAEILLPDYVNVKVNATSIFGGVDSEDHINNDVNGLTVNINATCIFGGVDIK